MKNDFDLIPDVIPEEKKPFEPPNESEFEEEEYEEEEEKTGCYL